MEKFQKEVKQRWNWLQKHKYFPLLCFAAGAVFTLVVLQIFATTNSSPDKSLAANQIAVEAESGTIANDAKIVSEIGASNGKYVQLGTQPAPTSLPTKTPTATVAPAATEPPASGNCTISDTLVNSCRPWLGATARNYPQAADNTKDQILYHEQRLGRKLDIVHTYHPVGTNKLSDTDKFFATRADTYLFANWKPSAKWADAGGNNASVNAGIDEMANSIKSLGAKKIFLTIHHEAENDVSSGGSCKSYKGGSGTAAQYKAMWRHVHSRFEKAGVTNVVWVMDYMNYAPWNCVVNEMYPGDDLVDWIMFNAYGQGGETYASQVNNLYNFLTTNSNSSHNYLSKPWGIVEWSINKATVAQRQSYFDQVKASIANNSFPKLKALMIFDERDGGSATGEDFRISYDNDGKFLQSLQDHYNGFAKDPVMLKN